MMQRLGYRSTLTRRSRGALWWCLGTFAVLQAVCGLAVFLLPEVHDPHYGYKAPVLLRRTAGRPLTVVMLGSSRTLNGFEAGRLEKYLARELGLPVVVFNFGSPGAGPFTELLYWHRLESEGLRPDLLLVEVLPPLLNGNNPTEGQWLSPWRLWRPELSMLVRYGFPPAALRQSWWNGWLIPSYTYRFSFMTRLLPNWLPWNLRMDGTRCRDESGWNPQFGMGQTPGQHEAKIAHAYQEWAPRLTDFRLGGPACKAIQDLVGRCKRGGIPTAMVLMPEGKTFQSWYPRSAWPQVRRFLKQLRERNGVAIIDAHNWMTEADFLDSHHLLTQGAEGFATRLGPEVLRLLREQVQKPAVLSTGAGRPGHSSRAKLQRLLWKGI